MKPRVCLLAIVLIASFSPQTVKAYDFSAIASTGQTLFFNINGGSAVLVRPDSVNNNQSYVTGSLIIPATVSHNGTTYTVDSIAPYALTRCSITEVTLPYTITAIGTNAFSFCNSLYYTEYTGTLAQWCNIDFYNAASNPVSRSHNLYINGSELTNLTVPDNVTTLKRYTFSGCTGLTTVTISANVTTIFSSTFSGCTGLTTVHFNATNCTISGNSSPFEAVSTLTIGNNVTIIPDYAFCYCTGLAAVSIPNSVTIIGSNAFSYCTALTSVTIGSGVTEIGPEAFINCTALTSVTFGSGVTEIGSHAFYYCTNLVVTVPNTVTTIGYYAFRRVKILYYQGSATGAPWGAIIYNPYEADGFYYTSSARDTITGVIDPTITSVTIPPQVTAIKSYAFSGCNNIATVNFNADSCTYMGDRPTSCTTLNIGTNVKMLPDNAFSGCTGLTSVMVPDNVVSVGIGVFSGCTGLTAPVYNNAFFIKMPDAASGNYSVPEGIHTVCGGAFNTCNNLTSITLPSTLQTLGENAFHINYPDTLRFNSPQPPSPSGIRNLFSPNSSYNNNDYLTKNIIVPCGHLSEWRASEWGNFPDLQSPCAHRLNITTSMDSIAVIEGLRFRLHYDNNTGQDIYAEYNSRWLEAGDTLLLQANRWTIRQSIYVTVAPRYGAILGWSNGDVGSQCHFVMPDHDDSVICIVDTMHHATLSANRITTPVYNLGSLSHDGTMGNYNYDTCSTICANGLWIGSSDSSVAASTYFINGNDYFPGPLRINDGGTDIETVLKHNRVWHITREMVDYHIAHCGDAGYTPVDDIRTWPGNGDEGYAPVLAPYFDADNNGRYNPMGGDYPVIRGDECVFSIFNDYGKHGQTGGKSFGMEVHAMYYAFNEPQDTALSNTVFAHFDLYNRSGVPHPDTYIGMWTDFDIGYAWDDRIGCDVMRGLYYAYNGNEEDTPGNGSFASVPPAQACLLLGSALLPSDGIDNAAIGATDPIIPGDTYGNMAVNGYGFGDGIADNERMGMTNFLYYENSFHSINGEPSIASDYYNYLHSYWKNGQHLKYGGNGISESTTDIDATFFFPGNSDPWNWGTNGVTPDGEWASQPWNEVTAGNVPHDVRGTGASGPFTFAVGSHEQFDIAYTAGFGTVDVASSIAAMQCAADNVRRQWANDTTDSHRPFVYMPYSAPHVDGIGSASQNLIQIYPNPTTGLITVNLPENADVQLFDITGRLLLNKHLTAGSNLLDLGLLQQGIYILKAAGSVQRVIVKK